MLHTFSYDSDGNEVKYDSEDVYFTIEIDMNDNINPAVLSSVLQNLAEYYGSFKS